MENLKTLPFGKKIEAFVNSIEKRAKENEFVTALIQPYWEVDDEDPSDVVYLIAPTESANAPWKLQRIESDTIRNSAIHAKSDYESTTGIKGDFICGRHRVEEDGLTFEVRFYPNVHYVEGLVERAGLEMKDVLTDEENERLAVLKSVFSHKYIPLSVLNQNPQSVDDYIEYRHFGTPLLRRRA